MKGRVICKFLFYSSVLSSAIALTACAPTTEEVFIRDLDNLPAEYMSLAALPKEPMQIDDNRQLVVDKLEIGQFEWGKSRFYAIELPYDNRPYNNRPYYLVVKSYMVSRVTRPLRYAARGPDGEDPRVFYPHLVMLDKNLNIISHSEAEDFEINTNVHFKSTLGFRNPSGDSWLQAAFRIDPAIRPAPKFAVISTLPDLVGRTGKIPSSYWPFYIAPGLELPITVSGIPIPVSIPMQGYQGSAKLLHFANVGELQIHLADPQDLLRTSYGRKMEWRVDSEPVEPGKIYQVKGLKILAPGVAGYGYKDLSSADHGRIDFFSEIPFGRGNSAMFAQIAIFRPGYNYHFLESRVESAIKEHKTNLTDVSYQVKELSLMGKTCKRIDFEGKIREMFFATFRGYDIHCDIIRSLNSRFTVRIGGSAVTNPAYIPDDKLPAEVSDFVNGVSLDDLELLLPK